jgi:hypothetical protein
VSVVSGGKWVEGALGICAHRDTQMHIRTPTGIQAYTHTPTYIHTYTHRHRHRLDNFCVVVVVVVAVGVSFVHVCGRPQWWVTVLVVVTVVPVF